jgi:hypothetical protein
LLMLQNGDIVIIVDDTSMLSEDQREMLALIHDNFQLRQEAVGQFGFEKEIRVTIWRVLLPLNSSGF